MGLPMATNLAKGGDRGGLRREPRRAGGGRAAARRDVASVADAAAQCAVLFTCLPNDDRARGLGRGRHRVRGAPGP
jgi:3-hydroxyisobutyrate dehydrogenase-like beta-hydroxyacid dehydrogenase